jgi:hypothetical protein
MQAGPRQSNSKWHSPSPTIHSAEVSTSQMDQQAHTQSIQTGIEGEDRNLPGQRSAQFLANDYGQQRHQAYDSQLAQPAYSGHGKVQVGRTSDL